MTLAAVMVMCCPMLVFAAEETAEYVPAMYGTSWGTFGILIPIVVDAFAVAAVSFAAYIVAGFVQTPWIALPVALGLMFATLLIIKKTIGTVIE